jgi:MATE family multidrug resistance protein
MLVGILVTSVTMAILLIWPEALVEIYLNQDDPLLDEVVALALPMVLIAAMFQIPDGLQGIANSVLRGLNDTRIPALLAIGSFWLFRRWWRNLDGLYLWIGARWRLGRPVGWPCRLGADADMADAAWP